MRVPLLRSVSEAERRAVAEQYGLGEVLAALRGKRFGACERAGVRGRTLAGRERRRRPRTARQGARRRQRERRGWTAERLGDWLRVASIERGDRAMRRWNGWVLVLTALGVVRADGRGVRDRRWTPVGSVLTSTVPTSTTFDADCPQLRERETRGAGSRGAVAGSRNGRGSAPPDEASEPEAEPGDGRGVDAGGIDPVPQGEPGAGRAAVCSAFCWPIRAIENARRYVRWHARRTAQLQVVQALIQRAGRELARRTPV